MIDMEWLRGLIRLVEESDIDSLDVERLTTRVRIRKSPPAAGQGPAGLHVIEAHAPSAPAVSSGVSDTEEGEENAAATDGWFEVNSPMVGTFYRAPSPESDAFVSLGDSVEVGQTLCILEAMKLMNELKSEIAGVVREIAAENAEPVEFGQTLFRIDPV